MWVMNKTYLVLPGEICILIVFLQWRTVIYSSWERVQGVPEASVGRWGPGLFLGPYRVGELPPVLPAGSLGVTFEVGEFQQLWTLVLRRKIRGRPGRLSADLRGSEASRL